MYVTFLQSLYDSNRYVRAIAQKLGFSRPSNLELDSPRIVEYPWILSNFPSKTAAGRILDVGSTGSQLPVMLVCLGFNVWIIDVRKYEYAGSSKNLHSVIGDMRKTSFTNGFFDIVTAVSSIEHIGLGRYGDSVDAEGDRKAMREIRRILTKNGLLLITVPFGKRCIASQHRVYDDRALLSLLDGFTILKIEYFARTGRLWVQVTKEQAKGADSSIRERAIATVSAYANR
jgi:SAM-dependent methyltransferase